MLKLRRVIPHLAAPLQWSKGEYPEANNLQDDVLVMQRNGIPLRADDHGNTPATATRMIGKTIRGVIHAASDVDMVSFAASGRVTVTVAGAARSPNLDVLVRLLDGNGNLLQSSNPPAELGAWFTYTLPSFAWYYLAVQGTGLGDPMHGGYTSYGSLGSYVITVDGPGVGAPPTAVATVSPRSGSAPLRVTFSGASSSDPDGHIVRYVWDLRALSLPPISFTGATATYRFTRQGTYTGTLMTTDNTGLQMLSAPFTIAVTGSGDSGPLAVTGTGATGNTTRTTSEGTSGSSVAATAALSTGASPA
jgi:PKD repeat protein